MWSLFKKAALVEILRLFNLKHENFSILFSCKMTEVKPSVRKIALNKLGFSLNFFSGVDSRSSLSVVNQ